MDLFAPWREPVTLRPYQDRGVAEIRARFGGGAKRVLYQAPTGSGKTVLFTHIVDGAASKGNRVGILAHRQEIVDQISDALSDVGVAHGVIMAGIEPNRTAQVQVASVATLVRRLELVEDFDLIVVDEAHHAVAGTWRKIIGRAQKARVLGVTATPERLDGKGLKDVFETLVTGPTVKELIDGGFLARPVTFAPVQRLNLSKVKTSMGDYAVGALSDAMSDGVIVSRAVEEYSQRCPGAPAIAFCVDIAHSELVAAAFRSAGFNAEHVDGETQKERRRGIIRALGDRKLDVLCNCGLVSEGLDVPGVVAGIMLRPTKSLALHLQQVGRTMRMAPGKKEAIILDHAGNTFAHGLADEDREWSLEGTKRQKREQEKSKLRRCPSCGSFCKVTERECPSCGASLRKERFDVAGAELGRTDWIAEAAAKVRTMGYYQALRWAGGDEAKLRVIASVRGYKSGWVWHRMREVQETRTQQERSPVSVGSDPLLNQLKRNHDPSVATSGNEGF